MAKFIVLGNEKLACIEELPAGVLLDLAEAAAKADMGTVSGFRRFLYEVVEKEDHERLNAALHSRNPLVDFDALNNAIGSLMLEYTKRPTMPPSDLQAGSAVPTGTPRRVSLLPVTDKAADQSTMDGAQAVS